jgi:quercetin dioxygenase-like cupin family protein
MWPGVTVDRYKDEPGTWSQVTRRVFFDSTGSAFQVRYFEIGPGGHTTLERHVHEHCVVVMSGRGRVHLDGQDHDLEERDVVHVGPMVPHQFSNPHAEPFGILCVVDRDRDRPEPLGTNPAERRHT